MVEGTYYTNADSKAPISSRSLNLKSGLDSQSQIGGLPGAMRIGPVAERHEARSIPVKGLKPNSKPCFAGR